MSLFIDSAISNQAYAAGSISYEFESTWGSLGSYDGQFDRPKGVHVVSSGDVYVVDRWNHRVQVFNAANVFQFSWGSFGSASGQFKYPEGIDVDSVGNVYIVDSLNHRISKFDSQGSWSGVSWGSYGSTDAKFYAPEHIAIDSADKVYVTDTYNHRIQKFDPTGSFILKWGVFGSDDGQLYYPGGIDVDSNGNVYVSDTYNHRIQKFSPIGAFIDKWGSYGSGDGQFIYPEGVAIDTDDNVYVVDFDNDRVQVFSSTGAYLAQWGSFGSGTAEFNQPVDLSISGSNDIFVADTYNNRIQKFSVLVDASPDTSANLTPLVPNGLNLWYTIAPRVSLVVSDDSVSRSTFYKWDGAGSYSPYLGSFDALEGIHTLYYYSSDDAGNIETVKSLIISVDTVDPTDPTPTSTSHTAGQWLNDNTVDISQSGASDSTSGVDGFSYSFTEDVASSRDVPDTTKDIEESASSLTSSALTDGAWYFHIRTLDNAGNWTSTQHIGPFNIDTVDPTDPTPTSSSHTVGGYSNDNTIDIDLTDASDDAGGGSPSESQITTNSSYQYDPAIHGDKIVWYDGRNDNQDIYMYNLTASTETRITTNGSHQLQPEIYGDKIVWFDLRNAGQHDIYMYDLTTSTESRITTNTSSQEYYPKIHGDKIVWQDNRNGNWDIYMHDLTASTETRITTNGSDQYEPAIYGDKIVWHDDRNDNSDIYMYNLTTSTESQITTNGSHQQSPEIYGDKIVWQDTRNGASDIYMYNLTASEESRITTNTLNQQDPSIYGDKIVWQDTRNGNWDIYMYDLTSSTESQITTNSLYQYSPEIYGDKIVWYDGRNGNYDIYMYNLGGGVTPSGVDGFSYSFTEGAASSLDVPDTAKDIEENVSLVTSTALADGVWYFHIRTIDNAGNWTSTVHSGPYVITTQNTPPGEDVTVEPTQDVTITFSSVDSGGTTTVTTGGNGHGVPGGFRLFGQRYSIETTAAFSGPITVCFKYDHGIPRNENGVRLFHYDNGRWVDITTSVDTVNNIVCGTTAHFSDFMLGDPITLPSTGRNGLPTTTVATLMVLFGVIQLYIRRRNMLRN